jgi:hypothetical protein
MEALLELPVLAFVVLRWAARRKQQGTVRRMDQVQLAVLAAQLEGLERLLGYSWLERMVRAQIQRRIQAVRGLIVLGPFLMGNLPQGRCAVVVNESGRNVLRSE